MRGVLGRGIDPFPAPRDALIMWPTVQDDLELSKAQRERIATLSRESRERLDRLMQEYRASLPPPDQVDPQIWQQSTRQLAATREAMVNQDGAAVLKVLQPRQRARLDQVQLQVEGPIAFTRPEILEKLNLGPDQIEAIQGIVARGREEMWATSAVPLGVQPGDGPLTPEQYRALSESEQFKAEAKKRRGATLKAREATLRAIAKILTKGQLATYRKLLGEPFDLAKLRGEGTPAAAETKQEVKADESPSKESNQNAK
jgi:hypothetical protein